MSVPPPSPDEPTAYRPPEETPTVVAGESASLQLPPGAVLGGRYRIVSLVGSGGMGQVYRADDLTLGQTVALKFLSRHGDVQRIYEEVRIGRQVSHPNVCRLYDVAEIDGRLFITMEFIDGEDLASLLRRIGAIPHVKALQVAREIAVGLGAAHEKGVIHRDLKPANVMIDGSGRARVTDFGLAMSAASASDASGTPVYMAPEQIERGEATFKSDIYSLGLIFYEIFKGKRLFESVAARIDSRGSTDSRSLSRQLDGVDPLVQRLIVRCLEYAPDDRPDLDSVVAALPGGDRLQAAVDAGETPSPEMVAAAEQTGDLSIPAATTLIAIVIAGMLMVVSAGHRTMLYRIVPLPKAPIALAERARDLIEKFGYSDPSADSSYIFSPRAGVISAVAQADHSTQRWRKLQSLDAPAIVFEYRQSPEPLIPWNVMAPGGPDDPPFIERGMVNVAVDPRGRLIDFRAVPPQLESPPRVSKPVDWNVFIGETGAEASSLQTVIPIRSAPTDTDAKFAWVARKGQQAVRIEAGSYHGKPVWFTVMSPGESTVVANVPLGRSFLVIPDAPPIKIVIVLILITAAVTARRNLRRGRGDRRGAFRVAAALFVTTLLSFVLRDAAPVHRIVEALQFALFFAAVGWVIYLALEPYVRRRWPRLLIGWSRLVSGQWRDAMVGRDLLIGAATGIVWVFLRRLVIIAPTLGGAPPLPPETSYLSAVANPRHALFLFFLSLSSMIFVSLGGLFVLLICRAVLRTDLRALAWMQVSGTIMGVVWVGENLPMQIAFSFLCELIVLVAFWRYGLLTLIATGFVGTSLLYAPLTLDPASWYFGRSLLFLLTVTAIATFGFFTSLGDKRLLPELAIDG